MLFLVPFGTNETNGTSGTDGTTHWFQFVTETPDRYSLKLYVAESYKLS
jgi:hypothetical protein